MDKIYNPTIFANMRKDPLDLNNKRKCFGHRMIIEDIEDCRDCLELEECREISEENE